jgi:cystathionine gamma-synthase
MLGFCPSGGRAAAEAFANSVRVARPWVSLGDVETLVQYAPSWPQGPDAGIPDAYVRVSVGIEDVADLKADFDQALGQGAGM